MKIKKMKVDNVSFYMEMAKGNMIKILVESFLKSVQRVYFDITPENVQVRVADAAKTILYNCNFPKNKLTSLIVEKPRCISVLTSHLYKQLKNIKKKDVVSFIISTSEYPDHLGVSIRSDVNASRHEINYIVYNDETSFTPIELPSADNFDAGVTIDACEFQKIKKFTSSQIRTINVKICDNSFLLFSGGDALLSFLSFGTRVENPDKIYVQQFNKQNLDMIIKLPGLCSTMTFSNPKEEGYPLRVTLTNVENADIEIFIKDSRSIAMEVQQNCDVEYTE